MKWRLLLTCLLPLLGGLAHAGEPSSEPILRIEAGMHAGKISQVAVDPQGHWLATAGEDGTARIWDIGSGALQRVLRVPLGLGNEGRLDALAISPDGNTVAVAGWTGKAWGFNTFCIYLFDRTTGAMRLRIPGMPDVINALAFSPNGKRLAAVGLNWGLKTFRVSDGHNYTTDSAYGAGSYGVDFAPDGHIVTTCDDGYLRLYDAQAKLIKRYRTTKGKEPFSAKFSPDGRKILVGYYDTPAVSLHDAKTLAERDTPLINGIEKGNVAVVGWSSDSRYMAAGGLWMHKGADGVWRAPLRIWQPSGGWRDVPVAENAITSIAALPQGGWIVASADPAWSKLDVEGRVTLHVGGTTSDFREGWQAFRVNADGSAVDFGFAYGGLHPARFHTNERLLETIPSASDAMIPPHTTAQGLRIDHWVNSFAPTLNGQPLQLEHNERNRCAAVLPGQAGAILGSSWYLRRFNPRGSLMWKVPVPTAWTVNVSGDGRWVIAGLGDGTIRWYRSSDGKEQLALFPHPDGKRWVLWTPSGYFDAAPGADDLLGWHLNQGKDQAARFYPLAQFRERFYRPDVIARILSAGSEAEALKQADSERGRATQAVVLTALLPPDIAIVSPADGTTVKGNSVRITYRLNSPNGEPVKAVHAYVDGRPVGKGARGVTLKGKDDNTFTIEVPLPGKDCVVALIAENRYAASEPATVSIHVAKATAATAQDAGFVIKPKLYVLAVGVSNYEDPTLKLGLAAKDARDFAATLQKQQGTLYREVVVKVLTDREATGDAVLDGLDWLRHETTSKDVGVMFLAGHGVNDEVGDYYYLPADVNLNRLSRTAVPFYEIKKTVENLAGKALFFVDTCHAGNVMGSRRGVPDINAVVSELSNAQTGAVVFASSTGNQYSLEDATWGNGAFTKALIEGLSGKADFTHSGRITINMLDLYLSERVKALTGGKQTPTTTKPQTIADFPLAVVQ